MDDRHDTTPSPGSLREEAARAWRGGMPEEAARLYGEAAALSPSGWEDLLLQGHALRAARRTGAALAAYTAAVAAAPGEPSAELHRGHALRLLGRPEEARRAYGLALAAGPGAPAGEEARHALDQMSAGGAGPPEPPGPGAETAAADHPADDPPAGEMPPAPLAEAASAPAAPAAMPGPLLGAIAFDVSDLLIHFQGRRTLTGIQRVQASALSAALRSGAPRRGGEDPRFLAFEQGRGGWRAVPAEDLSRLLDVAAAGADQADPDWIAARDAVPVTAPGVAPHAFTEGEMLVNLGNSWGIPGYVRALRAAQRARGVRYVPFLHDCVPLVMPEHCVRVLVQDYARWFAAVGVHAHGILCNSEATRADGRRFLDELLPGLDLPMAVVRLDADPRGSMQPDPAALEGTRAPRPPEPYVLFVATIESRKDHLTVFRAWLALLRRHGAARIPRLVCVGAAGWHAEAAMNLLAGSPELSRQVVLLHGISDGALAALYRDCLFTLYNSHHEGWGLPVTESVAWGKVPVVPRHSALVESGAGAAVFVEPQSDHSMAAAVERLLFEPGALAEAERAVSVLGAPRSWDDLLAEVVERLEEFATAAVPPPGERIALAPGLRIPFRRTDSTRPDMTMALSEVIRDGAGWGMPEDWGTPMARPVARLRLPLPPGVSGPMRLQLELRGSGGTPVAFALRVDSAAGGSGTLASPPEGDFATALPVVLAEGARRLELELEAPVGTGLRALTICREDDLLARLEFLERQRLPPVRVD